MFKFVDLLNTTNVNYIRKLSVFTYIAFKKGQNYCLEFNVYVTEFPCLYATDFMFNCNSLYTLNVYIRLSVILDLCKAYD